MIIEDIPSNLREEAVNKVIDLLEQWFRVIEEGSAQACMPDPNGKRYTDEEVDYFINWLDSEFAQEIFLHSNYHGSRGIESKGVPMDTPPEFNRLTGMAREAFVQDIKQFADDVWKSYQLPCVEKLPNPDASDATT